MSAATTLAELVHAAKTAPDRAESQLQAMLRDIFPAWAQLSDCRINRGSKVSLNSVNGTFTAGGKDYFFKFHAEEGEQQSLQATEYYRARLLQEQGWPVVQPVMASTVPGRQCVVYEKIAAPTAYDLTAQLDVQFLLHGEYDANLLQRVLQAETEYLQHTTAVMLQSLEPPGLTPEPEQSPLHQLFSHRLTGVNGATPRLDLFYSGRCVTMPDGSVRPFNELATRRWVINGVAHPQCLNEAIALARNLLAPVRAAEQASVVGHGDDHNGNKFLIGDAFVAFDPAFAGRHPALLAPIKATLHNCLLHPLWYYEPEQVQNRLQVTCAIQDETVIVTHNAAAILHSPLRQALRKLHRERVWLPLRDALQARGWLPQDTADYLRCAAFCCPFLAVNMLDAMRAPQPQLSIFNLAQCLAIFHAPALLDGP